MVRVDSPSVWSLSEQSTIHRIIRRPEQESVERMLGNEDLQHSERSSWPLDSSLHASVSPFVPSYRFERG